jgi:hypothetical protein
MKRCASSWWTASTRLLYLSHVTFGPGRGPLSVFWFAMDWHGKADHVSGEAVTRAPRSQFSRIVIW